MQMARRYRPVDSEPLDVPYWEPRGRAVKERPPAARSGLTTELRGALSTARDKTWYRIRLLDYGANAVVYHALQAAIGPTTRRTALRLFRSLPETVQLPLLALPFALFAGGAFDFFAEGLLDLLDAETRTRRLLLFAVGALVPVSLATAYYIEHVLTGRHPNERGSLLVAAFLCVWAASLFFHPACEAPFLGGAALLAAFLAHHASLTWEPAPVPAPPVFWPPVAPPRERSSTYDWDRPPPRRHPHVEERLSPDHDVDAIFDHGSRWTPPDDLAAAQENYWNRQQGDA